MDDFAVFEVPGLEQRMSVLIERIRPKLTIIGQQLVPWLSTICGEEMFVHVAKHARRTVHPPKDTWVAWAKNKRGYKALPHFQVGLWKTHVFIQFTVIYECINKQILANAIERNSNLFHSLKEKSFYWSLDHTKPEVQPISTLDDANIHQIVTKLRTNKNAEFMCGVQIPAEHPVLQDGAELLQLIEQTFHDLLPIYRLAFEV